MKIRSKRRWVALAATVALMSTVTACGAAKDDGAHGKSSDADVARYQQALDGWYKGTYKEPEGPAVATASGKNIWLVSVGLGIEYSVRSADAAKEAAGALGWSMHVYDAKFDPNQMLTGVQQAVVAKADGIILEVIDCATVKNALEQAKAAKIPVVAIESQDCKPGLFSHTVTYESHKSFQDATVEFGEAQAAWVVAKTKGQAKVVLNTGTDTETTRLVTKGNKKVLDDCPSCEVLDDVTWVSADIGPALQEKIQQTMVKHPDANAFMPSYDAIMTQSGGVQALSATGRLKSLTVSGGEGTIAGIQQIRDGKGMQMCAGQSVEWETYAAVDALARIFAGADPNAVDTGMGVQVCDKDHNLPAKGKPFEPPVDFRAAYLKLWGKN
ncbi:substrate-binding domain-containing protein [Nocardioides ginsengisoli]|uniref:Sugar ABC transporter substrate-binding protein n=1 Tax=Nocardioides ginsengisoli TaxID=363868 RepID=A0ABW3VVI7_9ACTN